MKEKKSIYRYIKGQVQVVILKIIYKKNEQRTNTIDRKITNKLTKQIFKIHFSPPTEAPREKLTFRTIYA